MASSFGDLVAAGRAAAGVSRAELGAAVGRSEATVRNWERGRSTPRQDDVFRKLALALDLPEDVLREGANSVEPVPASTKQRPEPLPLASVPRPEPTPSYRADRSVMITYWLRGVLTAVALVVMLVVLVWALGELFDAAGGLFDSLGDGP